MSDRSPEAIAADYLRSLEPGTLPRAIFEQFARLTVLSAMDIAVLRRNPLVHSDSNVEVLLTQRPPGDWWAGQWHLPGSIILPTDIDTPQGAYSPESTIRRILDTELPGVKVNNWGLFDPDPGTPLHRCARGTSNKAFAVWAEHQSPEAPPVGKFYSTEEISKIDLCYGHDITIRNAETAFRAARLAIQNTPLGHQA